jgi:MFS family permease
MAQSFWQLVGARVGVGLTEPGATPPAQSLIADYFPPEKRATALTIVSQWGAAAGALFGIGVGGYIATTLGWRMSFMVAGIPGLLLALVVRLTLAEPRSQTRRSTSLPTEGFRESIRRLAGKRSYLYMLAGMAIFTLCNSAVSLFLPSYLTRSMHATAAQISMIWGVDVTIANLFGALAGGWLADKLSVRDVRWYGWLTAISFTLTAPVSGLALLTHHLWSFISLDLIAEFLNALGIAVVFPAVHLVCGNRRRAIAVSILVFSFMFVGTGFGPPLAGVISDTLSLQYGSESLRYSLIAMLVFLMPAATAFYLAVDSMANDSET